MSKRPTISFSVPSEKLSEIKKYAEIKGFINPAALARKALYAYMERLPLNEKQREKAGILLNPRKEIDIPRVGTAFAPQGISKDSLRPENGEPLMIQYG